MDDISLTYLFGMKIVICVGCRKQILQRLENLPGRNAVGVDQYSKVGVRVTDAETLRIVEEEAGFCRFEVERLLNRCLRNKGADCNVVSGCFITAKKYGIIGGVDYQVRQVSFGTSSNWKLSHAYNSPVAHWVPDDVADRSNKQFPFKK
jgi:amino-acid N-acetyltransferase